MIRVVCGDCGGEWDEEDLHDPLPCVCGCSRIVAVAAMVAAHGDDWRERCFPRTNAALNRGGDAASRREGPAPSLLKSKTASQSMSAAGGGEPREGAAEGAPRAETPEPCKCGAYQSMGRHYVRYASGWFHTRSNCAPTLPAAVELPCRQCAPLAAEVSSLRAALDAATFRAREESRRADAALARAEKAEADRDGAKAWAVRAMQDCHGIEARHIEEQKARQAAEARLEEVRGALREMLDGIDDHWAELNPEAVGRARALAGETGTGRGTDDGK